MAYKWETFEHTADLGLRAWADTLEELFAALGEAVAAQICPADCINRRETVKVLAQADDLEALAVEFLSELLRLFQIRKFVFSGVSVQSIRHGRLEAVVRGEPVDLARHQLGEEIKAVTYHKVKIAREGSQWVGQVILDL
jgi:SHS2 domain-containing protein